MKRIGPFIVTVREKRAGADTVFRQAVRQHVTELLGDPDIRAMIAKCSRAVAKDYLEEQAEQQRAEDWRCPVCGNHDCHGPSVHGIDTTYQEAKGA